MQESICLRFSYRSSNEGARSVRKKRRQILSRTDRANEVNKTFYYMDFCSFFVHLSSDVAMCLFGMSPLF